MSVPPPSAGRLTDRIRRVRPSVVTGGEPIFPLLVLFGLNAIDEFDRSAFSVLLPNIRRSFGLDIQGVLTLTSLVGLVTLFLEIPIAHLADRARRARIAAFGALAWVAFSMLTGLATTAPVLLGLPVVMAFARTGVGLGMSVSNPTHTALLSDYYTLNARPAVFAFHRAANSVGMFLAPVTAGFLAYWMGWRAPFLILGIPTLLLVALAFRLHEPVRGVQERRVMGASEETAQTEEAPASFPEAWRILWQVRTLRRVWLTFPIILIPTFALRPLIQIFYEQELGLNAAERGVIDSIAEPFQFLGLFVGIPIAARLLRRDPAHLVRFIAAVSGLSIFSTIVLVQTRNLPLVIGMRIVISLVSASLAPVQVTLTSLIIPPRVRSLGFTLGSVFAIPALVVAPVIGALADSWGLERAVLVLAPISMAGMAAIASAGGFVASDIHKVRTSTLAMAEVRAARSRGQVKLVVVRDLDVAYDTVKVLFGVNFEVDEGEIVALLGTNGAGKSTLLKTISGLVQAEAGAIVFDGQDMTYAPPSEVARRGVIQLPGGRSVFPSLTVEENMRLAGWLYRRDPSHVRQATEQALDHFPVLRERWTQPASNLSGGEQQMLSLAMVFVARPRLLMIDELSLGLAPVIVEQLLKIVNAIRDSGTTVILVEQSVNVALTAAQTAYFMEKGEIRFHGPTEQLLARPDILRSVFLEGAAAGLRAMEGDGQGGRRRAAARTGGRDRARRDAILERPVVLRTTGLTKRFGGITAVNDVDLELHDGQVLGLIGPNGAGKTTIFDLVSGFVRPDDGRVEMLGADVTGWPVHRRAAGGLGRSFQNARLWPPLTVWEAIAVSMERDVEVTDPLQALLGLPGVRESEEHLADRVDRLIELLGLNAFRDKFVSELSTGSRRMVEIGTILANEPRILLLDEPSSGIAQRETEALGELLRVIQRATGTSILIIEHDMPLITGLADHIVALESGAAIVAGTPAEVTNHPRVVESYLGGQYLAGRRNGARGTATRSSGTSRSRSVTARRSPSRRVR